VLKLWGTAFHVLTPHERRRSLLVLALIVAMAVFEVVGVASVMPFLAVLANPAIVQTNPWLAWAYDLGGFTSRDGFLIALGALAFALLLVAAAVRSATLYAQSLFVQMRRHSIGCRLLEGYLNQPYEFFLNRHSGDLSKNILSEVDLFVDRGLMPMAQIIAYGIVLVAMVGLLLVIDPLTALLLAVVLGGSYVVIYGTIRRALARGGAEHRDANRHRFEAASEALGGIKSIKILGREARYLDRFRKPSFIVARRMAVLNLTMMLPRYAIEVVAFGGIILMGLVLTLRYGTQDGGAIATVLPVLGLYAFAGYRMLPAAQNIYQNIGSVRYAEPFIKGIAAEIAAVPARRAAPQGAAQPLRLTRQLELRAISYHYPNAQGTGVKDISLVLPRGRSLGIIGTTGAGKTTLVDVILGLLTPHAGTILIDEVPVTDANRRAWQDNLGYVPQEIYLTDATIAENIALGLDRAEIDQARIEKVARMARIHDFIATDLPEGYATRVGERGVRLSGGQRQRIGIARALYHDPEVIVFDEATSALDTTTEAEVMEAIGLLSGQKTLIIIAHRLTTVEGCDQVVRLDRGRMVETNGVLDETPARPAVGTA
jgi:ABC-type multidrug transport system fused ATPase/permease subunit